MPRILISAGEASGDLYASRLVAALKASRPDLDFFGCAGPRMIAEGVRPIAESRELGVVGLVEVLAHLPRIWGVFRKLRQTAADIRPDVAILTDSPDFHLPLATRLKRLGIPVVYLIAPQAWAWRTGRVHRMRRDIDRLLCIFPFEEPFFQQHGVRVRYIGHPLSRMVRTSCTREEFCQRYGIPSDRRLYALLPGSRPGEAARHLPCLLAAANLLQRRHYGSYVLGLPAGFQAGDENFWEPIRRASIQVIEGATWDLLAHSEVALAASGTVTIEAAILGTPMVTFYRVNALSWILGRRLVKAPFLSMVNLVAGKEIVAELIQDRFTGDRLAAEASRLIENADARDAMRRDLAGVAAKLTSTEEPMEAAASYVEQVLNEKVHIK